ncbi:DNA-directed DNA polymerase epsilon, subunit B [Ophidiomyces ophidiicola]|nr:DNA-directed DNA polymerase epsilon, subunit B [Ophidiomyces ophidiicola]KAI1955176.1 DNA-directed DNA polymerase epsilon, subunit B [Ophidiomyces ophidiicola]
MSRMPHILPILIPSSTLRPLVFRILTKKHSLTVTSLSLQALAHFVGKNCGSEWREQGLAEVLLDEVAKSWKDAGGGVIVEDNQTGLLQEVLGALQVRISSGRVLRFPQEHSLANAYNQHSDRGTRSFSETQPGKTDRKPGTDVSYSDDISLNDLSQLIRVVDAFNQPHITYCREQKGFQNYSSSRSVFSSPSHRVKAFRDRYNRLYQRVLRNKYFQQSPLASVNIQWPSFTLDSTLAGSYSLTLVSSLQGRNGTSHLLLGLLHVSSTGDYSLSDLTGSIILDLQFAKAVPETGTWFTPGMILLVDGIYEASITTGAQLGRDSGSIAGKFTVLSIAGPPCERREVSLGLNLPSCYENNPIEGFGWTDFLGVGSERANGAHMRRVRRRYTQLDSSDVVSNVRTQFVIISELNLDNPKVLEGLGKVFRGYNSFPVERAPLAFILIGNFVGRAAMNSENQIGSVDFKELFDRLAVILSEFPALLQSSTFIFIPGDNDPWASSFCAGASTSIPRPPVPELFTSRVRRVFGTVNEGSKIRNGTALQGGAIWTSNPTRISIFGPVQELVVFRDDVSDRLRRTSLHLPYNTTSLPSTNSLESSKHSCAESGAISRNRTAFEEDPQPPQPIEGGNLARNLTTQDASRRKLVKSLLDQGHLSPFPTTIRPILWDYSASLHLYPLPTTLILADPATGPFSMTYEGCNILNPGSFVSKSISGQFVWIEYDIITNKSCTIEKPL